MSTTPSQPHEREVSAADATVEVVGGSTTAVGRGGAPQIGADGLAAGTVVDATYRVLGPLGHGGMGVVLLARDLKLERDVALKLVRPEFVLRETTRARLLSEARAMARVHHENVVEVYAFGEIGDVPYIVMEYVPGQTVALWLRTFTDRDALPPIDEALGILDQVCRGVAAIHAAGTVHRDLKPSNVLVGTAFRVAVADLGLARVVERTEAERGMTVGTPGYIAPEILTGSAVEPDAVQRADVYSLGVMAFELLTGIRPFDTSDVKELLTQPIDRAPPTPSDVRPELPSAFDAVVLTAMARDPAVRTPTAAAFRRALLEARDSVPGTQRPLRILVADDDDDFRALITETIRHAFPGAVVVAVGDGDAALAACDARRPDLAIIDLKMPGLNGVELTMAIRASDEGARVPILVVTAHGGAPDWRLLSSLGADGFLVKPIDPFALVALARRTLRESLPPPAKSRRESMREP
ncbi:MAG: protein kinase [Deltaproteobacteria bacterium]|nr:protein kinase [Deltaproteobacteria bacterium]